MTPASGMQRYRLHIAYDGTEYAGWQRLGHDRNTIQEVLENTLSSFFDRKIVVRASGRTDAGVHAEEQVAHFDAPPDSRRNERLVHALQRLTPSNIIIKGIYLAPREFDAHQEVIKKTYKYRIINAPSPNLFVNRSTLWIKKPLDLDLLNQMTRLIVGRKDFKSFMTSGTPVKSTVREVFEAHWERKTRQLQGSLVVFTITGNGFLKQMVRNLVGTMLDIHNKHLPLSKMQDILDAQDRTKALTTAPSKGLSLHRVYYPAELDFKCRKL